MRIFGKWPRKWLAFEKGWIDTIKQIDTLSSKYGIHLARMSNHRLAAWKGSQ